MTKEAAGSDWIRKVEQAPPPVAQCLPAFIHTVIPQPWKTEKKDLQHNIFYWINHVWTYWHIMLKCNTIITLTFTVHSSGRGQRIITIPSLHNISKAQQWENSKSRQVFDTQVFQGSCSKHTQASSNSVTEHSLNLSFVESLSSVLPCETQTRFRSACHLLRCERMSVD